MNSPATAETYKCRYCFRDTPIEEAAAGPHRLGSRVVVNCKSCAGWAVCKFNGHDWDAAEFGENPPALCPEHEEMQG